MSPKMHQAAYAELGLDLAYVAVRVPSEEVCPALDRLRSLGYKGVNVTLPLKERVISWLRETDDFARRIRSVNTIRMEDRYGFNTDAPGFMETLKLLGVQPGAPTLVLGAGGTARAVIAALGDDDYPVRVWNRTRTRAEKLLEELDVNQAAVWDEPEILDAQLVVNTTSTAVKGERIPIDWTHTMPGAVAYELAYGHRSHFLKDAMEHDVRAVDGKGMLVMQGALSFEWWLDREAPRQAMWEAVH